MTQEFVTLPREVVERAIEALFCTDSEEGSTAYKNELKAVKKLRAALDQPQNHVPDAGNMVQAGWKLVPVEPTRGMLDAAHKDLVRDAEIDVMLKGIHSAMLAAAPQPPTVKECLTVEQPQANQPAMTLIAQRKLEDLMASGYTISGYSVYHERKHQHGFVTGAGLVGWWRPENMEYLQPQGDGWPEVARILETVKYLIGIAERGAGRKMRDDETVEQFVLGYVQTLEQPQVEQEPAIYPEEAFDMGLEAIPYYTHPQPKREPLTNEQIGKIGREHEKFTKNGSEWFDRWTFARAIEAAHNIK